MSYKSNLSHKLEVTQVRDPNCHVIVGSPRFREPPTVLFWYKKDAQSKRYEGPRPQISPKSVKYFKSYISRNNFRKSWVIHEPLDPKL